MEAAGLIEKIEVPRPLNFRFEDIRKLPPPIIAFDQVAFSYSGKKEDYLYQNLSFGIEYAILPFLCCIAFVGVKLTRCAAWTRASRFSARTERASLRS